MHAPFYVYRFASFVPFDTADGVKANKQSSSNASTEKTTRATDEVHVTDIFRPFNHSIPFFEDMGQKWHFFFHLCVDVHQKKRILFSIRSAHSGE